MSRLGLLILLGAAACVSGAPRPVRPAAEFQVDASPATTLAACLGAVADEGLPLRLHDEVMGVVETDYVDVSEYFTAANQYARAERLVRFRFVVAPAETGYGSTVAIEARYSPFATGAGIQRRSERAIPRDHPAMELVRRLQESIEHRTGS